MAKKYAVKSKSFDQPLAKIRLRIPGQGCECGIYLCISAFENLNNAFFSAVFGIWFFFSLTWMSAVVNSAQEMLQYFIVRDTSEADKTKMPVETDARNDSLKLDKSGEQTELGNGKERLQPGEAKDRSNVGISNPLNVSS